MIKGLWAAIAALFVVAVVGVATVSEDDAGGLSAAAAVANAAGTMSDLPSSTFRVETRISTKGESFGYSMDGVQHPHDRRSLVTMELPLPGGSVKMKVVTDGNDAYMSVPSERRAAAKGKSWVLFDVSGFAANGLGADPVSNLDLLKAKNSEVKDLGRDTIDGVRTRHYRAMVDPDEMAERIPALKAMGAAVELPTIPMDVWIDDAGRVVELRERFEIEDAQFRLTMKFRDFGKAPPVDVPKQADALRVGSMQEAIAILVGP